MKIKILKQAFLKNIQHVQNIISSKSSLPILSNILIEAEKKRVILTSTDLDIGISSVLETDVEEEGAITIPAKKVNDIIKVSDLVLPLSFSILESIFFFSAFAGVRSLLAITQ